MTGAVRDTLGQLAAQAPGTYHETFHFVLNDTVAKDNRIPPYGVTYEEARKRNALPVPETQYGGDPGGTYNYWDNGSLNPPAGAAYAEIKLLYQPTSWEYVQFLYKANNKTSAFLAAEGDNLLAAWLATGQAEPYVMASTTWGSAPPPACTTPGVPGALTAKPAKKAITLTWTASSPAPTAGYPVYYVQSGKLQLRAGVAAGTLTYKDSGLTSRQTYTYVVTWNDCNGNGLFDVGVDTEGAVSNAASGTAQQHRHAGDAGGRPASRRIDCSTAPVAHAHHGWRPTRRDGRVDRYVQRDRGWTFVPGVRRVRPRLIGGEGDRNQGTAVPARSRRARAPDRAAASVPARPRASPGAGGRSDTP
jgi:hypothetical protein